MNWGERQKIAEDFVAKVSREIPFSISWGWLVTDHERNIIIRVYNLPERREDEIIDKIHALGDVDIEEKTDLMVVVIPYTPAETREYYPEHSE